MSVEALLSELRRLGVTLRANGDRLQYDAPAGVLTAALRDELRATKAEILEFLSEAAAGRRRKAPPITPVAREGELPLSFGQERLWFLDQLEAGPAYHMPLALRLRGELDEPSLRQSLEALIDRHETLRTSFPSLEDGRPVQRIADAIELPLRRIDPSELASGERDREARRVVEEEVRRAFDLSRGPLVRWLLVRLAASDHVLVMTMHHIVSDGWSMGVLLREWAALYEAFCGGEPSPLSEPAVQYGDYSIWQREWLRGEVLDSQLTYWREQLADVPVLELPADRPRPAVQTFEGGSHAFAVVRAVSEGLRELCREEGVTLAMVLLGAWQVLLSRYAGQDDVAVGMPIAGRRQAELEGLIGFFVNTLVLRADLGGDPTFRELLARVREVSLSAYGHQDVPFEQVVEALSPERALSHHPLFQVMFAMQNAPREALRLKDLEVEYIGLEGLTTRFDLELHVTEVGDDLVGRLVYNVALFEKATIERMISHLQHLLSGIAEDPSRRLDELPMLSEAERHQVVTAWNDTATEYRSDRCVHELFEEQAARTPDATAVVFEDRRLTYEELNTQANQLAHHLRSLGVGTETMVGICVERSSELVVGLLGILKAGGAYVPLDPGYPRDRLEFMVGDARTPVVLTQDRVARMLGDHPGRVIVLDAEGESIARESTANLRAGARPENLAYTIYTSGSTGKPKGAMNPHRAICNRLLWMQEAYGLTGSDRVLQKTPFSFDVSVWEFFWPLLTGARLVLARPGGHKDPEYLVDTIAEQGITTIHFVPSMLRAFLETPDLAPARCLRRVICSGEALPHDLQQRLFERLDVELHNLYGPTEAAVDVTAWVCLRDAIDRTVPIGRPVANTAIYILDTSLGPVPIGVPGELYIGGAQVGRGYWNRPDLTAERFVPDPFATGPGDRLYRTGDLARYRPDGAIEFLSRLDHQVKVRGYRIELGEIESALVEHADVGQAVVVAREDTPHGDKRLVAYVVAEEGRSPGDSKLRGFLKERLPDYMVPSATVLLEALPLTPTGKVDSKSLPAPQRSLESTVYVAPRNGTEEVLCSIWSELLGVERVGVHDSFFELGGHSLMATQLVSRIRRTLERELPLREIFEHPTVAELSTSLAQVGSEIEIPPLEPVAREGDLPLSFAQERLWFLDQMDVGSAYNIPRALRLKGQLDVGALERSLSEIVRRHETLRTSLSVVDGRPVQRIAEPVDAPLATIDLSGVETEAQPAELERRVRDDAVQPFDLARGPLLRSQLLRLGDDDHVLLLTMHHIVSDGWSMGVFRRELTTLYEAFCRGEESPLPELEIQYADFASWQRSWLEGEALQEQLTYWRRQLAGLPPLELPTDHPRPAAQTYAGAALNFVVPPELRDRTAELCRLESVTLAMVLLAAWQVVLSGYSGQPDVAVGAPIANRTQRELESLIGFFVNTLVMRTDLSGDPSFEEVLRRVREVSLAAYEHQDVPFEQVVEELNPQRDLSRHPLFQVMFAMQNAPRESLRLGDLELGAVPPAATATRFDVELHLTEHEGRLLGQVVYNVDLFERSTIERMTGHLLRLLEGIAEDPSRRLSELPLLGESERHQVVTAWNDTARAYPSDRCVHELFEEQAAHRPEAIAASCGEEQLTYGELNVRANQLAYHLLSLGVGPEVRVGVCLDRSVELVVGILGILKAGGAYVPLASEYPPKRLAFMLEDTRPSAVLTQSHLRSTLPRSEATVIELDGEWSSIARNLTDNVRSGSTAQDLAYVMYTSGSTGRPKGTAVVHRGVVRLVRSANYASFGPDEVFLQLAPISFDASTLELWGPLLNGGKLAILPPGRPSLGELAEAIRGGGITSLWLTAALFHQMVDEEPESLCGVRQLLAGGDVLSVPHVRRVLDALPESGRLINGYGPTENTTFTCCHVLSPGSEIGETVPIGRPIANTRVYVLDRWLRPVPAGVTGELYAGGDGLARGYWNRPDLTAERFVPDPFATEPGKRLYRTGDLARYGPDGAIEFLGRLDHQVKVRGHRIEPGEIESVLREHPAVHDAAVVPIAGDDGDRRLVGYLACRVEDVRHEGASEEIEQWGEEHVTHWQELYEQTYEPGGPIEDPTFNITGWNSSYSGEPIPPDQMREWVDHTVDRIMATGPRGALEIGCGTGLLLYRIAPHCDRYVGTDFSQVALDYVTRHRDRVDMASTELKLDRRLADDFTGVTPRSFDTVILNSIVQYFPDVDYLLRVLAGSVEAVAAGGAVFVGDVRNFRLLAALHASVQLSRASETLSIAELRRRVQQRLSQEEELVVDPAFFLALPRKLPRISHVEVQPKLGRAPNELTKFRYDVTLHVEGPAPADPEIDWLDWERDSLGMSELEARLAKSSAVAIGIRGVPNGRTLSDFLAWRRAAEREAVGSVGELKREIAGEDQRGVDPQALWDLGQSLRYHVRLSWASGSEDGSFDVLFVRQDGTAARARVPTVAPHVRPWSSYTNNPLRARLDHELVPRVRTYLETRLPEFMVPTMFVLLDELPLTVSGKVDRRALPAPDRDRAVWAGKYVAPTTDAQWRLVKIWQEVLRLERVGVHDNFFDLGGHSLMATQLVSRLREAFGVELPLRTVFEHPTVAALARCIEEAGRGGSKLPPIEPAVRDGDLPLSFAQQRLWFLDQLEAGSAYHTPTATRLKGRLDIDALERTLHEIVRRHETLRTSFPVVDGQPVQRIAEAVEVPLRRIDLGDLESDEREREARRVVEEEVGRAFDLSTGPPVRWLLLRLAEAEHVLVMTMHHIVSDGWSLGVLFREWTALYEASCRGEPSPLSELVVQYGDFTCWQRGWLSGEVLESQLAYWREQLAEVPVLTLPMDRPRPAVQTYEGSVHAIAVAAEVSAGLRKLCRDEGATLAMVLLGAWQVLLGRYAGQDDVAVGMPIANRRHGELEDLIGFFVNTLVLRTDLGGDPTFRELLARVREVSLSAYANQDVPFEQVVESLNPERALSYHPLFQVMFAMQNAPREALRLEGMKVERFGLEGLATRFDLELHLYEVGPDLVGRLVYNVALFDRSTIERVVGHLRLLLEAAAAEPETRLSDLPLLGESERQRVVVDWNRTDAAYPAECSLHELFEAQADRTPQTPAVRFGEVGLTYGELEERSNRLAHLLRSRGIGPDVGVGICVERSLEMVTAVLGILKAGGAYVPLDPTYPADRLRYMLESAGVPLVLAHGATRERVQTLLGDASFEAPEVVCLDRDVARIEEFAPERPEKVGEPSHLAYVLFTSGSTGRPKGVAMPHGPLVNLMHWQLAEGVVGPGSRTLQFAPLGFDVSCQELFSTLASGGELCLVSEDVHRDPARLLDYLSKESVERIFVPFVALRQLAEVGVERGRYPSSLREVITAGEQLQVAPAVVEFFRGVGSSILVNQYGPTECHVVSSWTLSGDPGSWPSLPPIGRPIANARLYVLDGKRRPAPIGVPGELYVGGAALARGYLNDEKLTAERFVADPFAEHAESRLYRTGDLARYLADGTVEYLGRADHQVKLRGFRVELGEIESVLMEHAGVRQAVAMVRQDGPGQERLVAYVVHDEDGASPSGTELRSYLVDCLPAYMVPSSFVSLDALPLTPSGKVHRRALPAPAADRIVGAEYLGPRNGTEEILCEIWAEVLPVEKVGVHDDFFELGGHSLLATQLVSRIRRTLERELALREIFEHPTVAKLAARLAEVSSEMAIPPLTPVDRKRDLPLSFAQERLWFLDQLEAGSAYHMSLSLRLRGELDEPSLRRSLEALIERHETLRTSFPSAENGIPVQRIAEAIELPLRRIDLSALANGDREREARGVVEEDVRRAFDLSRGPLVRWLLVRLCEAEHVLVMTMHHIVSDGWSLGVLFREWTALYEASYRGEPSPLAELVVQYGDYTIWQREWLSGEALESQLAYWREQLADAPILELPTDHPRPAVQTYAGAVHDFVVPPELRDRTAELCRQESVTLAMVLLGAWQVVLSRYSGQLDVAVGAPIANRTQRELEPLIGFFVNTLVMRTDLGGDPTFRELLARVREVSLSAYGHQDVPFEQVVEALSPERALSHHPLFQVMFAMQNAPREVLRLEGVKVERFGLEGLTTRFDLELHVTEVGDDVVGRLVYNVALFEKATIERMTGHLLRLLEAIAEDPSRRLSELPLLSESERHEIVAVWNDTATEYPSDRCVHELFEEQAARRPEAIAASCGEEQLTYGELNVRANQLAYHLRSLGVGPEVRVSVCLDRSVELLVGILGILKAGGAYVPLAKGYPTKRLAFMLEDTRPSAVLTQSHLRSTLPSSAATVIELDGEWPSIARHPAENVGSGSTADDLAYVVYTSGSTGRPKGTAVVHRGVVRLVRSANYASFGPDEVFLQLAPISFDASTLELWGPLLNGGKLAILPPGRPSLGELAEAIRGGGITSLWLTAALFHQMVDEELESLCDVRQLLAGGDVLSVPRVRRLLDALPESGRLVNGYGPTENTTFTCCHVMSSGSQVGETVPIGRPIANTRVHVLDRWLRPVPAGVTGELYAGGDGLARGYWDRPDLTAERFVPDPFATAPGQRLYRTGDLARFRTDGNIEFLGRLDDQVKVRGYRIEPGEIESVLVEHAEVRHAVVVAREDTQGEEGLVAYVVAEEGRSPGDSELRSLLKERLPDYMVPSAIVTIESLPLTPTGKVDRSALPAPQRSQEFTGYVAPRSGTEEVLCSIWAELLGVERVGVHDDFFELGGHSLLATQLVSRIRRTLEREVALREIFEHPTVAELGAKLAEFGSEIEIPPLVPVVREGDLPLSFAQERLWFLDQMDARSAYNMPMALRLKGQLDAGALERALHEIVRRHETLRTSFPVVDGQPVQRIADPVDAPLARIDLSDVETGALPAEIARRVHEEAGRPFDLARGPLMRSQLLSLGDDDHVLLLTLHHIVSDAWSLGVLHRELSVLYAGQVEGRAVSLPELAVQYADYASWQRSWLQGEVLAGELSYWRRRLGDGPPPLDLPTDRPRPRSQSYRGDAVATELSAEVLESLRALSRSENATLFMVLVAAFKVLLMRYSSQEDILIGMPIAGRHHREIEGLIGCFLNTLVLRTDLSGSPSFREVVRRVRRGALEAYGHQDIPFEKLLEELQPERDLSRSPLFQVFCNMVDLSGARLELPGLEVQPVGGAVGTARFDLTLYLFELDDRLVVRLNYSTDLFDRSTVALMLSSYATLLEAATADAGRPVGRLPLLGPVQRRRLAGERNRVSPATMHEWFPEEETEQTIAERFAKQVARTPDHPAVKTRDRKWTYGELDAVSNRVGWALREQLGGGSGQRVALLFGSGAPMVAGVLGTLRCGQAYVPLDPAYPASRLRFMLDDAGVRAIVTESRHVEQAHALAGDGVAVVDVESLEGPSGEAVPSAAGPESLAYILYTSGTSGRPQGVMQSHRNVLGHVRAYTNALHLAPEDRLTLLSSYTFDGAVMDLYGALLNGATLLPASIREEWLGELLGWLVEQGATVYHSTPSVCRFVLSGAESGQRLETVRAVVLGGEEARGEDVALFRDHFGPECVLVNGLGPSESTLGLQYFMDAGAELEGRRVPVGYAVEGTRVVLLETAGEPTDLRGEIGIESPHVALGYWGLPARTASSFGPSIAGSEHARLYRTGDLGRLRADGSIEFLGRLDEQVKVRGYRIEPGEIESVLLEHPAVRQAAAVAREDAPGVPGDRRLVAYVVAEEGRSTGEAKLGGYLKERLPEYMVPSAIVMLDAMPLTPNGKLDRSALPAPPRPLTATGYVEARNGTEEVLCSIWSELLGVERVGVHDDFFELGGHSLMATRLVSRIRRTLERELALREIFEHRTVAELGARLAEVSREVEIPALVPVAREGDLPLSFAQERLWFLDQLEAGPAYHMPMAIRLRGELDERSLRGSLEALIERHESLRTSFPLMENGLPAQRVAQAIELPLRRADLSDLASGEREREARREVEEEVRRAFDLSRGPLVRWLLVRLSDTEHVLVMTMHHIVSDGWSMGVLLKEWTALYEAIGRGEPSPLAEPVVQYGDFTIWQREWLSGEVLESELAYWREQLTDMPMLELPADRPRPPMQTFEGGVHVFAVAPEVTASLRQLCREEGMTPAMVLLAAWQVLLGRYAGQDDVSVGIPIANRRHGELEGLIGFFVNTLVLRTDLGGDPTFREVLARVREVSLSAYAHQDVPFEQVVEALNPERALSHHPLFQVMFAMQNAPREALRLKDLEVGRFGLEGVTTRFDLELQVTEVGDDVVGCLVYNVALFEKATIERMVRHLQRLLSGIAEDPSRRLDDLPLLSESDRHEIVESRNDTARAYPSDRCVHELFEEQAARTPEAVAVSCGEERLTYGELDAQSNQLAHHLRSLGVGPDVLVGLCVERSVEMLVGVLGILKSGGAYVPLDPSLPVDRLRYMLRDSRTRGLVTTHREQEVVPAIGDLTASGSGFLLCLDSDAATNDAAGEHHPETRSGPGDLAYSIYTSGSTGRPKGVEISHRNVVNLLVSMASAPGFEAEDVMLAVTTLSFDIAVLELLLPLSVGGRVVIASRTTAADGYLLAREIERVGATVMQGTPATWRLLAQTGWRDAKLKMLCGGEELPHSLANDLLDRGAQLWNMYGPTESTVWSSIKRVDRGEGSGLVPIGSPISNTRIYVLDRRFQPLPRGVIGELFIGGDGVARGYGNRTDLTAERFVPDPFAAEPGGRLYRTGDLARFDAKGELRFLGRADDQVKLRGFRIELGEIESVLVQIAGVEQAAVVLREDRPGDPRLVAYVLGTRPAAVPDSRDLQRVLGERLPSYMVPSAIMALESFPLTPSGKLNRRALPKPEPVSSAEDAPPESAMEIMLAGVWKEVLAVGEVSVHDYFLDLGGHSLLAVEVVSRMEKKTGVRIGFVEFWLQSLGQMASLYETRVAESSRAHADEVARRPRNGIVRRVISTLKQFVRSNGR